MSGSWRYAVLALAAAGVGVGGGSALADGYRGGSIKDAPIAVPVTNWTGFYIGGHGGFAWSDVDWQYSNSNTANQSGDGGFGGVQAGYNWQLPNGVVLGLEADASWGNIEGSTDCPNTLFRCEHQIDMLASIRARLGYSFGRTLGYVTGGLGYAAIDYAAVTKATGVKFGTGLSSDEWGWTLGAGIEHMITPNWTVKLEYLHYGFDGDHAKLGTLSGLYTADVETSIDTIKLGVNYKF